MNLEDLFRKQDEIVNLSRGTEDEAIKEQHKNAFFDAAIDFFNENLTGDITLADGSTHFIPAIENPK